MTPGSIDSEGSAAARELTAEERRWLHDKFQQFDQGEAQLADFRSSYMAAITTGLVAATVYAVVNLLPRGALLFATTLSLLAALGIVLSVLWALVLRRTTQAQNLWRQAAFELEARAPPLTTSLPVPIRFGDHQELTVNLTQPYHAHRERFETGPGIPALDRIRPAELSGQIPVFLAVSWAGVIVLAWAWFLWAG